jgi:DGQHR domain-containing protein
MREVLLASFTDAERNAALTIGETVELAVDEKVEELFRTLGDPLLSAEDISSLLGATIPEAELAVALAKLLETGALETTDSTQRPLDNASQTLYRLSDVPFQRLRLLALQQFLPNGDTRFQFSCDARLIRSIARVQRLDALSSEGQQREEILSHVRKIAKGIKDGIQVPNAVLITFLEEHVTFEEQVEDGVVPQSFVQIRAIGEVIEVRDPQFDTNPSVQRMRLVEIDIPFRRATFDDEKSALLVDGQQRTAALSLVPIESVPAVDFPVNAMIRDSDGATEIFAVANQARPIATDFTRALSGAMSGASGFLKDERLAAIATKRLAVEDDTSPFRGITRYPGLPRAKEQVVVYNTLFLVVNEFKDSALKIDGSADRLAEYVRSSFLTVRDIWPEAWAQKPSSDARLMGGLGMRAMAKLIVWRLESSSQGGDIADEAWQDLREFLTRLRTKVVFTQSAADLATAGAKKFWRTEIRDRQNTNQDVTRLFVALRRLVPSLYATDE